MLLICIMGRTGAGKGVLEARLEEEGFKRSISYTTREPQIRNGVLEKNGKDYRFISKVEFMNLVNKNIIIEHEEYNGNMYGTPRPYGSTKYVAVVGINGYRSLKSIYGSQVVGVYLNIDEKTASDRANARDKSNINVLARKEYEDEVVKQMENEADIIIDSSMSADEMVNNLLNILQKGR